MYFMLLVLDDSNQLDAILDAWAAVGVRGATISESTGIYRQRTRRLPLTMRFALPIAANLERGNTTLFAIVADETIVMRCLEATENITGDLELPNTGIFSAWPVPIVKGLPKISPAENR